jgi:Fe-S cluster assembly scaffold protein SufB
MVMQSGNLMSSHAQLAKEKLSVRGMPNLRDEDFLYCPVRNLNGPVEAWETLEFSFASNLQTFAETTLWEQHFASLTNTESDPFALQCLAHTTGPTSFCLKQFDGNLRVKGSSNESSHKFGHLFIHASKGSSNRILAPLEHTLVGKPSNLLIDILVDADARLDWFQITPKQHLSTQVIRYRIILQGKQACFYLNSALFGMKTQRISYQVFLQGEHSEFKVSSRVLQNAQLHTHQHLHLLHSAPNTKSSQNFRMVGMEESQSSVDGKVEIAPSAPGTQAEQLIRNLLLSRNAKASGKPTMKIFNPDVQCSHGYTTGNLSPEELFYMNSRGIPDALARKILTRAFLNSDHPESAPSAYLEALNQEESKYDF